MQVINTHEAKTHLSKLLSQVALGKEVIIGRAGQPIAKLVPLGAISVKRKGGQLKNQIFMAKDFDILPSEFMAHFANKIKSI